MNPAQWLHRIFVLPSPTEGLWQRIYHINDLDDIIMIHLIVIDMDLSFFCAWVTNINNQYHNDKPIGYLGLPPICQCGIASYKMLQV